MKKSYLLILSTLELGGAERQALNFAKFLLKRGCRVVILGLAQPGVVVDYSQKAGVACNLLKKNHPIKTRWISYLNRIKKKPGTPFSINAFWLANYIREGQYDICISYCAPANTLLGLSRVFYKQNICVWYQRDKGLYDSIEGDQAFAIRQFDYILANSDSGKEWLKNAYQIDATVVHNGVKLLPAINNAEDWRKELGANKGDVVYTKVANLHDAKDHMTLLKAWNLLKKMNRIKNKKLVFAGNFGNTYEELSGYVRDHELTSHVRFLGRVDDVTGLLHATDVCVFSTAATGEGSPNGLIEAELVGLPVVATDLPEIRAVVSGENHNYLFELEQVEQVADLVTLLGEDEELRFSLGEANRIFAENTFSEERNFSLLVSLVEQNDIREV